MSEGECPVGKMSPEEMPAGKCRDTSKKPR